MLKHTKLFFRSAVATKCVTRPKKSRYTVSKIDISGENVSLPVCQPFRRRLKRICAAMHVLFVAASSLEPCM